MDKTERKAIKEIVKNVSNSIDAEKIIKSLRAENERLKAEVAKYKSFWDTHFSEPITNDVITVITTSASTDIINGVSRYDIMNKRKKGGE